MFDDGRIFPVFCVKKKDGQTMLFFCLRLEKGRWIEYHKRKTFIREREMILVYNGNQKSMGHVFQPHRRY